MRSSRRGSPNPNKANLVCENKANCGKTGHLIEDCFQLGGGKQGQYPWWKGKWTAPTTPAAANLATTSDGDVRPGSHYALFQKVALAAGHIPDSKTSCSFADSGCTIHFFKNKDVFSSYRPLDKMVGQSSKEGAKFNILGSSVTPFTLPISPRISYPLAGWT